MFNRSYQQRAVKRAGGGRTVASAVLECPSALQIDLFANAANYGPRVQGSRAGETFEEALEATFPAGELTDEDLYLEFCRLFPE